MLRSAKALIETLLPRLDPDILYRCHVFEGKNDLKVEQAKEQIKKIIAEQKLDPQKIVRSGQLAEFALKDNKSYPMIVQQAIKEGLANPEDANEPMNPKELAGMVSAGKIAQMIIDEGQGV